MRVPEKKKLSANKMKAILDLTITPEQLLHIPGDEKIKSFEFSILDYESIEEKMRIA